MSSRDAREHRGSQESRRRLTQTRRPRAERAYLTSRLLVRHAIAGLPAIAAFAGVVAVAVLMRSLDDDAVRRGYLQRGLDAARAGDAETSLLSLQRVADQGADAFPVRDRFEAVLVLLKLGDLPRALDLLEGLAPAKQAGYPPAQVFRATRILERLGTGKADLDAAETHLLQAVTAEPQYLDANTALAQLYLRSGRNRQAVPYLERASAARPEMLIILAKIDAVEGERERALDRLKQACVRFETICKANPDDRDARLYWGEAATVMEDFPTAASILKEGFSRSDDPRFSKALGRLYLAWHDVASKAPEFDLAARLGLLEQGLRYDPSNLLLLDRFSAPIRGGGDVAERAKASLREQIEKGRDTAAVRYALGVYNFEGGNLAEARDHWERAYQLAPNVPYYANNYAFVLAMGPSPDPSRALAVIDPVIERWPKVMEFRDTRGQILAKLGRWYDARVDLEEALRIGPPTREVHRTLAEVYEKLGEGRLAAEQRRLADEIAAVESPGR